MPRRSYRVNPLGAAESAENFRVGVTGRDQPNWHREFVELIERRYESGAKYFSELRKSATEWLRGAVPRGLIPNYLRFAMKAAKLAMAGATESEFYGELSNVVVKNGLNIEILQRMFSEVDELKKIEIDWDRLRDIVETIARR